MGKTMEEIRASKPKAEMSKEHLELRGDVENDKPFYVDHYTPEEWRDKAWFERKGSEAETYSAYVDKGDLVELEL